MEATLGESLEENLLILLAFNDEKAPLIRGVVDAGLFTGLYREIAARIYTYIDRYKVPPKEHLPDILDDKINSKNKREARLYEDILDNFYEMQDKVNTEYAMEKLNSFIKRQALRSVAVDLVNALKEDTEESLERADEIIGKARHEELRVFDPGLRLNDVDNVLNFLHTSRAALPMGIKEFDKRQLGPSRRELLLYISKYKGGKTWFLTNLVRSAIMHRYRVCHITLEVTRDRMAQRYMQNIFSLADRKGKLIQVKFEKDKRGRLIGFDDKEIRPRLTMDDPNIEKKLRNKIMRYANRFLSDIVIKDFPRGKLTIPMLETYLDNLENTEKFVPDLIVLDYPELMNLDNSNIRLSIDETYKNFCGLLFERNMAGAVVSQSHRQSADSKYTKGKNVAEAYSKVAHADTVMTYSQTDAEEALGLARVSVDGARHHEDNITVIVSQNYHIGKFSVDSALMTKDYWDLLKESEPNKDSEEDDD